MQTEDKQRWAHSQTSFGQRGLIFFLSKAYFPTIIFGFDLYIYLSIAPTLALIHLFIDPHFMKILFLFLVFNYIFSVMPKKLFPILLVKITLKSQI